MAAKLRTSPRYMIDITGTDPVSLGELGRGVNSEQIRKMRYF